MGKLVKLAYLTGEYPRATDTFIQREVAVLRELGHEVLTCSIRKTDSSHLVGPEQRQEARQSFYVLNAAKSPARLLGSHWRALRKHPLSYFKALALAIRTAPAGFRNHLYQLFYFAEAAVLADELMRQGVTHLHNHIAKSSCTVAMLAHAISGIPFSFTLHGPDIFFAPEHWRLDEKIRRAKFVACISHFSRSQAMAFSESSQWHKLHIVHCGVAPDAYGGVPVPGDKRVLFVGRLAAVKGMPVLLEAMQKMAVDATLTVIGDGEDRCALEEQTRRSGLAGRVSFVGYKSQAEVAAALNAHDLFVLPSFAEGVPVVLMEAMAAERAIVTTRIAGVPELVEDTVSGLLVPPGDADALANALDALLKNKGLQKKLGQAGREKILKDYNIRREGAWLSSLFEGYSTGQAPGTLRPETEIGT